MQSVLTVLGVVGIGAAAWHVLRAAFRLLGHEARGVWAEGLADTHARHGDVTGMAEARAGSQRAARARKRAIAEGTGWLVLLLAPSFTPWAREIYATYVVLALGPLVAVLRRRRG